MAGGWRYPYTGSDPYAGRQTSVDALYKPQGIDPEFLKKLGSGIAPAGLLDKAVGAKPLQGLLDAGGGAGMEGDDRSGGGDGGRGGSVSGATGIGIGSMSSARDAAAARAGLMGFAKGGLGLLGVGKGIMDARGVIDNTNADVLGAVNSFADPIAALNAIQGWTTVDQGYMDSQRGLGALGYGASPVSVGPPEQAQAKSQADAWAETLAAMEAAGIFGYGVDRGGLLGGGGYGSAGQSFGGAGNFGAGDYGDGTGR